MTTIAKEEDDISLSKARERVPDNGSLALRHTVILNRLICGARRSIFKVPDVAWQNFFEASVLRATARDIATWTNNRSIMRIFSD